MARGKKSEGNGNGEGKRSVGLSFDTLHTDEEGRLVIDDLVPASVLLMFFIQKLGQASLDQIAEKVKAAFVVINHYLLGQAVEALRARQFVSYAKGHTSEGERVTQYKPRRVMFAGIPDTAQVSQAFLSSLVSTPDAEELIASLNDAEEEGDGQSKAKEKLRYADYYAVEVTLRTENELVGGRPVSPHFEKVVARGPKCPDKCDLRFPRDGEGWPIVPLSNVRGWLEGAFRRYNITPAAVSYIGISGGHIEFPEGVKKIDQHAQPVVDLSGRGGGRGLPTYEVLPAGCTIKFLFTVPKRGCVTPDQLHFALASYAPNPVRGLSNARSNEYGKAIVVDFEMIGEVDDAEIALRAAMRHMSAEGRKHAEEMIEKLRGRRLSLRSGKHTEVE